MRSKNVGLQFAAVFGLILAGISIVCGVIVGGRFAAEQLISLRPISTREAPGFTETKFASIKPGMSSKEVVDLLGKPLREDVKVAGYEMWYTGSKEPINGWGKWEARYVIISNGFVVEVHKERWFNH